MEQPRQMPSMSPEPESLPEKIERLKAVREAYMSRLMGSDRPFGPKSDKHEVQKPDATVLQMNRQIEELEKQLKHE